MPACAVCGARCPPPFRVPAAEMAPDLDGRPGEPARSTLRRWIASCPSCGAAGPDLAALPATATAMVRGADWDRAISPFLRWSRLVLADGQVQEAAEAVLWEAWRLDDREEEAAPVRLQAAAMWQGDALRLVDILRRAGAFAEARAAAETVSGLDEDAARIVTFQLARIDAGDKGRHAISSALRPPARSPHVTHVQPKTRPGLLSRWFGR